MSLVKTKLAVAVALALTASFGLVGCGDDKGVSTAVGVPNPNTLMPVGTIQGVLRDTVTNAPIVGAVVDIGVGKATTSETGQFVISNVPATKSIGASGAGENAPYQVTIDLRNVKQAEGATKYPSFSFASAAVSYSSLNDGSNDTGASSSNHDTPVTGLVAPLSLNVGKLAAGIKGVVIDKTTYASVGAGYKVKLIAIADSKNSSTGDGGFANVVGNGGYGEGQGLSGEPSAEGNLISEVTTGADGAFEFKNIESLRKFKIVAEKADGTTRGEELVKSPGDGQIKTLLAQRVDDNAGSDLRTVFVETTDTLAPIVLKSTPETGTERAPGANVTVAFNFSEPIVSNGLTNSLTSSSAGNGGLHDLVDVQFKGIKDIGMKAGNIPFSLAWNETRTQLTVVIPKVKASAKYEVSIKGAAGILVDNQNQSVDFEFDGATTANSGIVKFSTTAEGAAKPAAVTTLAINNNADLDQINNAVVDWLPVTGAKGYHVYRAKFVDDVIDVNGYVPIKRTAVDSSAAKAAALAAATIVAEAKVAATTAAKTAADAAQNANIADATANAAVKAAAPTVAKVTASTASAAGLTATTAKDSRSADKVATKAIVSDSTSKAKAEAAEDAVNTALTDSTAANLKTVQTAKTKVNAFNNAVKAAEVGGQRLAAAAAASATAANTQVRVVNTKAMVAKAVAATIEAVANTAAAVAAVDAAAVSAAVADVKLKQAAVDADPTNADKLAALGVAQTTLANANKAAKAAAKQAKAKAEAAATALAAADKAAKETLAAVTQAKTDAQTAAKAKTDADADKVQADKDKEAADKVKAAADKALVDANKAVADANKAVADAKTEAAKIDAAEKLAEAEAALITVQNAAAAADAAADTAAIAADVAADAATAAADAANAANAATTAAVKAAADASAAVIAITTAVNAADAAADALDVATANDGSASTEDTVLTNNANSPDMWRAKIAAALAKATATAGVLTTVDGKTIVDHAKEATALAKAAADNADKALKAAKDIVVKAAAAVAAVETTQKSAATVAASAKTKDTAATTALNTAKADVTAAWTALTTAAPKTTGDAAVAGNALSAKDAADKAQKAAAKAKAAADKAVVEADKAVASLSNDDTKKAAKDADDARDNAVEALTAADNALASANKAVNTAKAAADAVTEAKKAADKAATDPDDLALKFDAANKATAATSAIAAAAADAKAAADEAKKADDKTADAQADIGDALVAIDKASTATPANTAITAAKNEITAAKNELAAAKTDTDAGKKSVDAYKANQDDVTKKDNLLAFAKKVEAGAIPVADKAAKDLKAADKALAAANDALVGIKAAKAAADAALTEADAVKVATDKVVASMKLAEADVEVAFDDYGKAVTATKQAEDDSKAASLAADAAFTAAVNKVTKDKNLVAAIKDQVTADKNLADSLSASESNKTPDPDGDVYLTQNTSFAEAFEGGELADLSFVDGVRKVTYKYKVRAVSEDNVESDDGNEVTAQDNTKPKVSYITMNSASNVVTVVFSEPMNEVDFRNKANYVLAASANTNVTVPALSNALFKVDNRTVVLTYAANVPAGSTVTVSGVKDLAGNVMSNVGNTASVDKVTSSIVGFAGSTQVTVFFSADMNKASAETAANYTLVSTPSVALLAANGVMYNEADNSVTLTYATAIPAGAKLTVTGVKDVNGTTVDTNTKAFD